MLLATCLAFGTVACGSDDPDNGGGGISGSNSSGNNNSAPDAGDADASEPSDADASTDDVGDVGDVGADGGADGGTDGGSDGGGADEDANEDAGEEQCPAVPCEDGEDCVDGECMVLTPQSKCDDAEHLGTLSEGSPITISDTTDGATDVVETMCSTGGDELIYSFDVAEDSVVSFTESWPEQFDAKVEFRFDTCTEPDVDTRCFDGNDNISLLAGTTAYVIIEQDVGRGNDFELELSATADSCPSGVEYCDQGALQVCLGDGQSDSFACADDCFDGDDCAGTVCDNAIEVSGSTTFQGDLGAYLSDLDFESNQFCQNDGISVSTPGPEVAFRLDGLSTGQTVEITAGVNSAVFITQACSSPLVCEDVLVTEGSSNTVDWDVSDGANDTSYYVIIDKRTGTSGEFTYGFDITNL
ncbi:MAG: hypothetical protein ACLFVJ_04520 [Persicimonas sp.]